MTTPWRPRSYKSPVAGDGGKRAPDRRRSASRRGYDAAWRRFREWFLSEHPQCEDCGEPSTEVHHVEKVKHAPEKRLEPSNCMALCKKCHSKRTKRGE